MLLGLGLLLLGGLLLYFGAEWLVRGAAGIATAFGVRPLVIGLTVVAYGTSAPELAVSVSAALQGRSAIVLGNVVGSNIANLGLILGATALVSPPRIEGGLAIRELPVLLLSALSMPGLLYFTGGFGRVDGAFLLLGSILFTLWILRVAQRSRPPDSIAEPRPGAASKPKLIAIAALGLVVLFGGGELFVSGAIRVAREVGMSERLVGLTIVALGTSVPELAASLVAAARGHSAMAVGNVIGSNIFNVLLVLGSASLLAPLHADLNVVRFDLLAMVGLTVIAAVMLHKARQVRRWEGALLVGLYAAFMVSLAFT